MKMFDNIFYLFIAVMITITMVACQNGKGDGRHEETLIINTGNKPFLAVEKELDFGRIDKRKTPRKEFSIEMTNTGNSPLVIIKADVTCGCMKITHTKHPISIGEKGFIEVEIDASNQKGYFNKPIIIKSNAHNHLEIIRVKGVIN